MTTPILSVQRFMAYQRWLGISLPQEEVSHTGQIPQLFADRFGWKEMTDAVAEVYRRVRGAYSVVGYVAGHGLFAFRDPYGIKPIALGRRSDNGGHAYAVASESVVLDTIGYETLPTGSPGEALFIDLVHPRLAVHLNIADLLADALAEAEVPAAEEWLRGAYTLPTAAALYRSNPDLLVEEKTMLALACALARRAGKL